MNLYRIRNWGTLFENNRTRELKKLDWLPIPNKQDGDGYTLIMEHPDGAAIFGAWIACAQIASRCDPRGTLMRDGAKPHDAASLSRMSRIPVKIIETMLSLVSQPDVNWLEIEVLDTNCDIPAPPCDIPANGCLEGKGREGKEGNEEKGKKEGDMSAPPPPPYLEIHEAWNSLRVVPQCLVVSDKRRRLIQARWRDSFFVSNWRPAMERIKTSRFLTGTNDRGWKASFDWFLQPDTCARIMEGKYQNSTPKRTGIPNT